LSTPHFDSVLSGFNEFNGFNEFEWLWLLVGLCVGSFLNVLIYRLPLMLIQFENMVPPTQTQTQTNTETKPPRHPWNLWTPRSHCTHCQMPLRLWHNIPLLSFLFLRGRCADCQAPISWQYPLVEVLTSLWFGLCAWHWGGGLTDTIHSVSFMAFVVTLAWSVWGVILLALAWIDGQTQLLPDELTLPLLWLGLIVHAAYWGGGLSLQAAVWGAVGGYGVLWLTYWLFWLVTRREGLGYGDFKLLAALGAWLGWQALPTLVFMAALMGLVYGGIYRFHARHQNDHSGYFPFGPALVASAFVHAIWGLHAVTKTLFFWMM
jgi:leader peptidase (prepilin peptidase)/N-methyltransferase